MANDLRCKLSPQERRAIERELTGAALRPGHCRRIQVILMSDDGTSGVEIARRLGLSPGQVSRIRRRYELAGSAGLADRPKPGRHDHAVSEHKIALILELAASPPPLGAARWLTRRIAVRVGLTSATVAKVLRTRQASSGSPTVVRAQSPIEPRIWPVNDGQQKGPAG